MTSWWTANNLQVSGSPESEHASIRETDESLAARVNVDPEAFAELYRRFFLRIFNFCLRRLRNTEAAEDVTSQIFLKALEGFRQSQVRQVTPWLFTIAYREVANRYRTHKNHLPYDDLIELPDGKHSVEDQIVARGDAGDLHRMLARLTPDQRLVLDLRLAGLTGPEIRKVMGKSRSWVDVTQHRALKRLRLLMHPVTMPEGPGQ